MYSLDLSKQLLKELWKRKLRTFLGLFGICWGTVSVILLLALGSGYYAASVKSLSSIAGGAMMFYPGVTSMPYRGYPSGMKVNIKANQIIKMGEVVHGIKYISPSVSGGSAEITYMQNTTNRSISGVNWSYAEIWKLRQKIKGRFLSLFDVKKSQYVVVLGSAVAKTVFKGGNPVGQTVSIWGLPFLVVGVITSSSGSGWMSQKAMIPFSTMLSIKGDISINTFDAMPYNVNQVEGIKQQIRSYLGGMLHFNPADKRAINSPDLTKLMRYFTMFFLIIEIFLGICGLITLVVGGISVANMMFLIVTERTREIGLRMALGAKRRNILFLVMLETFLIVFIGGLAGIIFSKLTVYVFDWVHLPEWIGSPVIHYWTMSMTVIDLFMVTFVAGIFPARSAAKMQPVEALSF